MLYHVYRSYSHFGGLYIRFIGFVAPTYSCMCIYNSYKRKYKQKLHFLTLKDTPLGKRKSASLSGSQSVEN